MLPLTVLYYGQDRPLPEPIRLQAGPLSLVWEEGGIRYIHLGDQEVLRGVYVAVRDTGWGTVPPVCRDVRLETWPDSFRLTFQAVHQRGGIDLAWQGTVEGDATGTVNFCMAGQARSTFRYNRIGLCVLHPAACAGRACVVEHVDGRRREGRFPLAISPHQPFREIRAIAHQVAPGVWAEVRLEGEIFEMEDQRNWTDASFKTYCPPLARPYPLQARPRMRVAQTVTLSLLGAPARPQRQRRERPLALTVGRQTVGRLPRLGLGVASHGRPLSERAVERLRALNLAHLRVELDLADAAYPASLGRAAAQARALTVPLEVALVLAGALQGELAALAGIVAELRPPVWAWLLFAAGQQVASADQVRLARRLLAPLAAGALFGAGSGADYVLLNRSHPPLDELDVVCYGLNPQVHAFDNASLVETLAIQALTLKNARAFCGAVPLAVTPVTLKPPRPGPVLPGELPPQVDPRQMSLFGAAWTAASLKYLAEGGAHSATYYETEGWLGVQECEEGSPLPERFRSLPGSVFPLYHILADVGEFARAEVIGSTSSDPLRADGLALRRGGALRVLLANMTGRREAVRVHGLPARVRVRPLDETNAVAAMQAPEAFRAQEGEPATPRGGELSLELLPYAVVRVDG